MGNRAFADLRKANEEGISPSQLFVAATMAAKIEIKEYLMEKFL